jgi:nicotinamide-nucleotide amidase
MPTDRSTSYRGGDLVVAEAEIPETKAIAATLMATLQVRGETLATAESITGGLLAGFVTGVPGASEVFLGGVVSYATEVKKDLLKVTDDIIETDGVVSARCAEAMASGVRDLIGTTYAVSTTGVAGPETQDGKPVGTVYVGLAGPDWSRSVLLGLDGDRGEIRETTCAAAISELLSALG